MRESRQTSLGCPDKKENQIPGRRLEQAMLAWLRVVLP